MILISPFSQTIGIAHLVQHAAAALSAQVAGFIGKAVDTPATVAAGAVQVLQHTGGVITGEATAAAAAVATVGKDATGVATLVQYCAGVELLKLAGVVHF